MDALSLADVAARAGVSPEYVARLVEVGVLTPGDDASFRPGDIRRAKLVSACERAGLPLEGIGEAIAAGKLSFAFLDLPSFRWRGRSTKTYAQLAAEMGVPVELLLQLQEAMGFAAPDPADPAREDDLATMPALRVALASGMDRGAIVRIMRVYGESLRRIAEAETQVYHSQIEMPLLRSGMGQREMLELASNFGTEAIPVIDEMLLSVYHRQQERAWIDDLIEHVESALEEAGVHRRAEKPSAMCFLDLTGYTRLTEEGGDELAAELAASLAGVVQRSSQRHGGQPVKWLGDGVMFHFKHPAPAVVSALEMVERTPEAGLPPAHVGIGAGRVIFQDGDYFGRTVNIASRIAAYARPGQVLVNQDVVEATGGRIVFREIGPVELKGISRPVVLHEALRVG